MRSLPRTDDFEPSGQGLDAAQFVLLRSIRIDDWSDVRYVHGEAFSRLIGPRVSSRYVDEFMTLLGTPEYVDRLVSSNLYGAWFDGQLAGTVGWRPKDHHRRVAQIEGLFVQPLFTFMGLGSLLLTHAEAQATRAGYRTITALATFGSVPFFMRLGYDIFAQGAGVTDLPGDMPAFLMRKQEPAAGTGFPLGSGERPRWRAPAADGDQEVEFGRRAMPGSRKLLVED
jgi:GNAT superfamily N-acetyltransferase